MGFLKSPIYKLKASWTTLDPQKWDVEVKGQNRGIKLGLCWYGWAGFVVEQSIIILQYSELVLGLWLSWVCVEQSSFIIIFFYDFSEVELGLCWAIKFYYNILLWFFCVWFLGLYDFFGFVLLCVLPFWNFEFLLFLLFLCSLCF